MIPGMKFLDYTTVKGFLPQIKCRELREVVAALVETLQAEGVVQDGESLTREVLRREAADSTAIGAGLVLPHARCRDLKSVHSFLDDLRVAADGPAMRQLFLDA